IVKGRSGIEEPVLVDELLMNNAFRHITNQEMEEIISYLIKTDMLERAGGELIIGLEGELVVNSREFYTVFKSEDGFKVVCEGNTIGEVPFSPLIMEGENLFLAAKIWKISTVDLKSQKIIVMPAKDGKRPIFFGTGAPVHPVIREKMLQLLLQTHDIDYLDEAAMDELRKLRASFAGFKLTHRHQRPLLIHDNRCELYTFTGTKINRALSCLLTLSGIQNAIGETSSEIDIEELPSVVKHCWKNLPSLRSEVDHYLVDLLQEKPNLINFSKWGYLLPQKYQIDLLKNRYYDFNGAFEYIEQTSLVSMTPENKKG
ncbi:MAG: hypothetical protein RR212_14360, partial [Bacteroidales bacterium]